MPFYPALSGEKASIESTHELFKEVSREGAISVTILHPSFQAPSSHKERHCQIWQKQKKMKVHILFWQNIPGTLYKYTLHSILIYYLRKLHRFYIRRKRENKRTEGKKEGIGTKKRLIEMEYMFCFQNQFLVPTIPPYTSRADL